MAVSGKEPQAPTVPEAQVRELVSRGTRLALWPKDMTLEEQRRLAYAALAYGLDPFLGDLTVLGGKPYVCSGGLRRLAEDRQTHGIHLGLHEEVAPEYLLDAQGRIQWVQEGLVYRPRVQPGTGQSCWKAELKKSPTCGGFVEFGEASFDDVGLKRPTWKDVRAMARTRAVNRVIRLAYAVAMTSVEELGIFPAEAIGFGVPPSGSPVEGAGGSPVPSGPPVEEAGGSPVPSDPPKGSTRRRAPSGSPCAPPDSPAPSGSPGGSAGCPAPSGSSSRAVAGRSGTPFTGTFAVSAAPEERSDPRGKTARVQAYAVNGGTLGEGERCVLWSRLGDHAVRGQILALKKGARVTAGGTLTARAGHLAVTELAAEDAETAV